jgi:predicted site-specific integrase-resolvase
MTAPKRTPRTIGVDAETLSRWRSRGLLRARELHGDQLRPGCENAARLAGVGAAPMLVCGSDDLVAVKARPVD